MDMTPGSIGPFADRDNPAPSSWHQEFASPTQQPNKLSGLVEELKKCRAFEQADSPTSGRRDLEDQNVKDMGSNMAKSPEMQERAGGPPPFIINRPVNKASQAASAPIDLMDMDMDMGVETEHREG